MAVKSKKSDKRYPGTDPQPWVVKDTTGKRVAKNESYDSFTAANADAKRYTEATGLYAGVARA